MTRWLVALVAAAVAIAAGYVAFLNPEPIAVHLTPARTVTTPLAVALLTAFAAGCLLVGLGAALRAGARGWRNWQRARRTRREARLAASTARARELVWAGDYGQARAELARGVRGTSGDATRLALIAETHLHAGDSAAARPLLEQGVARLGPEPRLLDLLAETAERTGDLHAAADALERARESLPASPRLAGRLRDVYAAAGRWAEAVALQTDLLLHLHEPSALAAEQETLRGLRYQAALAETDVRQAARLLVALAREHPDFVPAWVSAGDLLAGAGRRVAARRIWERGARRRPAPVLLERLARLNADRPERTTRLYRRLRRRHPETPAVPLLLVRHLLAQGALEDAAAELAALPTTLAGHPLTHALWGELHRRRGNHTLAAEAFARAAGAELGLLGTFRCAACRSPAPAWAAACAHCRRWGTLESDAERVTDPPNEATVLPPPSA